ADLERSVPAIVESAFGCAGQRCLAGSVVIAVGGVYEQLKTKILAEAKQIVVGNGLETGVTMGPGVAPRGKDRIRSMIERGVQDGGTLLVDGRKPKVKGNHDGQFIGPTIFVGVESENALATEEVFGPVMILRKAETLREAIDVVRASEYANATSIFTRSGG